MHVSSSSLSECVVGVHVCDTYIYIYREREREVDVCLYALVYAPTYPHHQVC
jgi:hypothetical protein